MFTSKYFLLVTLALGANGARLPFHESEGTLQAYDQLMHVFGKESNRSVGVRDTPYWYENIAHQGISAFGPADYQVYRNVKDFGARGK